ncbi:hypothetical protein BABINDRAFT_162810 [Babjeviella inositovora NRRL Y-12698]|uniref:Uncharacterized protein n=1 Tax=Babjeviella inositovora NRRL Y-12698 TaxID=984486 RepID=A0A1E3QNE3_9ASCO|nr:uncharacterized protein BABINDRAFT_162810 [Babjeviella inositovora NRRL Y-12698]ODQ78612.1 hypothetical protein BABINDRAFT_162810 [Babjeviella inositovora NRRL Y-12698]
MPLELANLPGADETKGTTLDELSHKPDKLTAYNLLQSSKQFTRLHLDLAEPNLISSTNASIASSDTEYQQGISTATPSVTEEPAYGETHLHLVLPSPLIESFSASDPIASKLSNIPSRPSSRGSVTSSISMVANKDGIEGGRVQGHFVPPPYLASSLASSVSNLLFNPNQTYTTNATNVTGTVPNHRLALSRSNLYIDDFSDSVKSIKSLTFDDLDSELSSQSQRFGPDGFSWSDEKPGAALNRDRDLLQSKRSNVNT